MIDIFKAVICTFVCLALVFALTTLSSAVNCSAKSAILIEAEGGEIIYEKNAYELLPMASTTKIMTAVVALEKCDLDKHVTVTADAVGIEGSSLYLKEGDRYTMRDLLYGLMLQSANDAAVAIAVECAGSIEEFARMMNDKASELGLTNTHFMNPNGLDCDGHYTTAFDLARLTSYALKNADFSAIVSTRKYSFEGKTVVNHNKLLSTYSGCCGVKTGFTKKSGRCLVSAAERDGVKLVCVTLCDGDDWRDHTSLLDFGFTQYKKVQICGEGTLTYELPCTGGVRDTVKVTNRESLSLTLKNDDSQVSSILEMKGSTLLFCPVKEGEIMAEAVFYKGNQVIARVPLYSCETVEAKEFKKSIWDYINIFK